MATIMECVRFGATGGIAWHESLGSCKNRSCGSDSTSPHENRLCVRDLRTPVQLVLRRRNVDGMRLGVLCSLGTRSGRIYVASVEAKDVGKVVTEGRSDSWRSEEERERKARPKKPRKLMLKPPLEDIQLAERFLSSPQLQLKSLPLLSSCLPPGPLNDEDQAWISEYIVETKEALGLTSQEEHLPEESSPAAHLNTLLYLAFQHSLTPRGKTRTVGIGHSRLWFLGQFVVELAFAELTLQMFPRETVGALRERVFALTRKKVLPALLKSASIDYLVFSTEELQVLKYSEKQIVSRSVFWALIAALYLTLGLPEVYRLLFEVFGMDLDAPTCQPKPRGLIDEDFLSPELEGILTWQDIAYYKPPEGALFSAPRLFRACVPPGIHRFRGNLWEVQSLPSVREALGYPRTVADSTQEITDGRNAELELGLQLCFMHPCTHKFEHPRFCYERFEYLGSKVKDVILAEQLLMKHLDGPAIWLGRKHRMQLMNRLGGRTLREKKLTWHIIYSEERKILFEKARRLRNYATTGVQHAIHGLGYTVYGRAEVRRLMSKVFNVDQVVDPRFL